MKNFRVLVLKNPLGKGVIIKDDIAKWIQYEKQNTPLTLIVDVQDIDIKKLKHKAFGTVRTGIDANGKDIYKTMYGLDGIKQAVRDLNIVPKYLYHAVIFMYDFESTALSKDPTKSVGHWTYWKELYSGTEFIEIATRPSWDKVGDIFRVLTHEIRHVYVNIARRKGKSVADVMDNTPKLVNCDTKEIDTNGKCTKMFPYYKEFDVFANDGNRYAENLLLRPFWDIIAKQTMASDYIKSLQEIIKQLTKQLAKALRPKQKVVDLLVKWAKAIQNHEGFYVGSRSYRNNNPANMRYTKYTISLGAIGKDKDNFCIFKDYKTGFNALVQFLKDAKNNKLLLYKGSQTLLRFFEVYAPSFDNNNPLEYARAVAKYIGNGVTIDTQISNIQDSKRIQLVTGVKYGDKSELVQLLQKALISLGYSIPAGATGYYGEQTSSAVLKFHQEHWEEFVALDSRWTKIELEKLQGKHFGNLSVRVVNKLL